MAKVYLVQDIPVDRETGQPKYNANGCTSKHYGAIEVSVAMQKHK